MDGDFFSFFCLFVSIRGADPQSQASGLVSCPLREKALLISHDHNRPWWEEKWQPPGWAARARLRILYQRRSNKTLGYTPAAMGSFPHFFPGDPRILLRRGACRLDSFCKKSMGAPQAFESARVFFLARGAAGLVCCCLILATPCVARTPRPPHHLYAGPTNYLAYKPKLLFVLGSACCLGNSDRGGGAAMWHGGRWGAAQWGRFSPLISVLLGQASSIFAG